MNLKESVELRNLAMKRDRLRMRIAQENHLQFTSNEARRNFQALNTELGETETRIFELARNTGERG